MRTYIYPENLRSKTKLWFWNVKDFCILCAGIIISAIFLAKLWTFILVSIPFVPPYFRINRKF